MLKYKKTIYKVFNNSKNQEENRVQKLAGEHLSIYVLFVFLSENADFLMCAMSLYCGGVGGEACAVSWKRAL